MLIRLFVFFLFIYGAFQLLNLTPKEYIQGMMETAGRKEKQNIKKMVEGVKRKKKERAFTGLILEVRELMEYINQAELFSGLCVVSVFTGVGGFLLALLFNNILLAFPLSIGTAMAPFLYMKFRGMQMKTALNEELETAVSIVTTSYLRSEDIIRAVQENLDYIRIGNIHDAFEEFVVETTLVTPDIPAALENLQGKIENDIFKEWIDGLLACQNNKNLKNTLLPIVEKFSDVRIVTGEMTELLYSPVKEFITMLILTVGIVPLFYFINREWFQALVTSGAGKFILAVVVGVIVYSISGVIKNTKPVEYRR